MQAPILQEKNSDFIPLHVAAYYGRIEVVKLLIKEGANINATYKKDGNTVLHLAAQRGEEEIVSLLIKEGVNIYLKNKKGKTALDITKKHSHKTIVTLLENTKKSAEIT